MWKWRFGQASQAMVVAIALSVPLSTAGISVATVCFLVFWVLSGEFAEKWQRIRANPVALAGGGLFALFVLGLGYSTAGLAEGWKILSKYRELLLVALFISALKDRIWIERAYFAVLGVLSVVIVLSYGQWLGWLPQGKPEQEYTVFAGRIAGSILLAYIVFLFIQHYLEARARRWLWGLAAIGGAFDLFFLYEGRTGYAVFFALMLLLMGQRLRGVRLAQGLAMLGLIGGGLFLTSSAFQHRVVQIRGDIAEHQKGNSQSPVGERLMYYENSLEIIRSHPILGTGTGSFKVEYARFAEARGIPSVSNPHNEYLLVAVQLGVVGLIALLGVGSTLWHTAKRLAARERYCAEGIVVAMAVGCLFNSLLMDNREAHFFACLTAILFARLNAKQAA